ncbi:hypothetical protein TNCV_613801 [Trichonephila clavipes]|nr:hypothetical protein TNCV_613801 [Trichonephila clavipes]
MLEQREKQREEQETSRKQRREAREAKKGHNGHGRRCRVVGSKPSATEDSPCRGTDLFKSAEVQSPPVGLVWMLGEREGVSVQMPSSSAGRGLKLRDPSPIVLVLLHTGEIVCACHFVAGTSGNHILQLLFLNFVCISVCSLNSF